MVGARPNFMKAAPLYRAFEKDGSFDVRIIHTGQHYDEKMSDNFFKELSIPRPEVNLEVGSGSHGWQTAKIIEKFEKLLINDRPDWVVVFGDVNSTIACALVCAKMDIKIAHVEAGLRSFDRRMPEEINRILTDQISNVLFTPSIDGNKNLHEEGIDKKKVYLVGNIMVDTLLTFKDKAIAGKYYEKMGQKRDQYIYLTMHRPSNVDHKETLVEIFDAIDYIQQKMKVIFAVHPRTKAKITEFGLDNDLKKMKNLTLIEPVGYFENLGLQEGARAVITDSGGMQEETTVLGVPCLTMRENTERPVTVTSGTSRLVLNKKTEIIKAFNSLEKRRVTKRPKYWDGKTSERVVKILKSLTFDHSYDKILSVKSAKNT